MYIGAKPNVANFVMLDSITTSATATFNLTKDGVAYYPPNSLACLVSLNGINQKAGSSFNIVNNTIVFSEALTSNDVIDYILVMAEKIDLSVPADSSVTNAKTNFVSTSSSAGLQIKGDGTTDGTLQLNCSQNSHGIKIKSPPHSASASYTLTMPNNDGDADQFLQTNGSGVLSWASAGGGITEIDQWRLTTNITSNVNPISANLERVDDPSFEKIGTGMSVSSGFWTFPSTGLYQVIFTFRSQSTSSDTISGETYVTIDNSSYDIVGQVANGDNGSGRVNTGNLINFVNVTNTSNVKVKFAISSLSSGAVEGSTDNNLTCFSFLRLGDSV